MTDNFVIEPVVVHRVRADKYLPHLIVIAVNICSFCNSLQCFPFAEIGSNTSGICPNIIDLKGYQSLAFRYSLITK